MFVSLAHPLDVSFSNDIHIMEDSLNLNTPLTLIFLVFVFWIPMQVLGQLNYIIPSRKKDCCTFSTRNGQVVHDFISFTSFD